MTDLDVLLARFIEDWNAGRRPAVEDFLRAANELERDELADQISTFLAFAPTPRFDEETIHELLSASAVDAAAQAFVAEAGAWPTLLPRLRAQAGLSLRDLATRVLSLAGSTTKASKRPNGASARWSEVNSMRLGSQPGSSTCSGRYSA